VFSLLLVTVVATVAVSVFGRVTSSVKKSVLASQTVRLTASADAAVSPLAPTANTGSSQILELKRIAPNYDDYVPLSSALVKFDLSSIPTGATVTEAKLKLFINSLYVGGPSSARVGLFAGLADKDWSEYQVNFRTMPDIASDIAEEYYLPDGYVGLVTLDVTNLVSEWVSGSTPNYGFLIYSDVLGNSYDMKLASREAGSAGPLLGVVYNTSASTFSQYPGLSSDLMSRLMGFASAYQGGQMPDFSGLADLFTSNDWTQGMRDFMSQFENFTPPDPTDSISPNGGLPTGIGGMGLSGGTGGTGVGPSGGSSGMRLKRQTPSTPQKALPAFCQ